MKFKYAVFAAAALMTAVQIHAREQAPTTYNAYDGNMPGARALAMGYAVEGSVNDTSAIYYNPAALAFFQRGMIGLSYEAIRQGDIDYDSIFASEALKNRSFVFIGLVSSKGSFSWRPLADNNSRTVTSDGWTEDQVKINSYCLTTTHSYNSSLSAGLNLHFITGQIARSAVKNNVPSLRLSDGYGFSSDLAFLVAASEQLNFGINFENLLGTMWWDDYESEQLPFTTRSGISFKVTDFFTFGTDWESRYYRKADTQNTLHFGLEQMIGSVLSLRCGIYSSDFKVKNDNHYTAGLGYSSKNYLFSIAGEKYIVSNADVYRYLVSIDIPVQ